MTYSFNLIDQAWIPCIQMNGYVIELNLLDVFKKAAEFRGIQGDSPLETASIYRLLFALIHSITRGPADQDDWEKLWKAKRFDSKHFIAYFEKWRPRFDLFDEERPFYQFKDKDMFEKSALLLPHGMSTANELFEHQMVVGAAPLSFQQAARMLLVGQYFGLGGLVYPGKPNLTRSPLINGVSFLVEGDNLFETLLLNCLQYAQHKPIPTLGKDEPTWEMETPFKPRGKPNGYLDYLTWQNRKVLLIPNENDSVISMQIMRGLDLGKDVEDPFKLYIKKDDGWKFLPFTKERSLWRDSHTLLRRNDPNNVHPPKSMEWLAWILEDTSCLTTNQIYRYMALGAGVHYKDAKIYFYRHENMPLPLSYLTDDNLVSKLTEAVTSTELVKSSLNKAVFALAKNFVSPYMEEGGRQPDAGDINKLMSHWSAEVFYWSKLETPFNLLVMELPNDHESAITRWNKTLQQTAWDALRSAERMAGEGTSALKAAVRAEGVLRGELTKLFESTQPQQEVKA